MCHSYNLNKLLFLLFRYERLRVVRGTRCPFQMEAENFNVIIGLRSLRLALVKHQMLEDSC